MRSSRGMGAIAPSKMPKRTVTKRDGMEPVSLMKKGGTAKQRGKLRK